MNRADLVIRNATDIDGQPVAVAIRDGQVVEWGVVARWAGPELDADGGLLLPGFHDHHIHLLATAARLQSVDLSGLVTEDDVVMAIRRGVDRAGPAGWLRVVGYDERAAGLPDAGRLTQWLADRPVRLQDRTGALWVLNRAGLERLGPGPYPAGVELDARGRPTGRIWREDVWLRERIGARLPELGPLGEGMLRAGITGVTDAGAGNGTGEATLLAGAGLAQRLMVMGRADLEPGSGYLVGPVKIAFDERDLPSVDQVAADIIAARAVGRCVAAHCVTLAELAVYLSALEQAGGTIIGDRIEHGGVIAASLIGEIARLGLTVITQPAFINDRGDRFREAVDPAEIDDLYRLRSLIDGGVKLAAGSDAPYGSIAPLVAVRAAMKRRTKKGHVIGAEERIGLRTALGLYLGKPGNPGLPRWRVPVGHDADLCLLAGPAQDMQVSATLIGGHLCRFETDCLNWVAGMPLQASGKPSRPR